MPGRSKLTVIPSYSDGWNSNTDQTIVRDGQFIDVDNADFDQPGKVTMRGGVEKIGASTGSLAGSGLFVFRASSGTEYLMVRFGGTLFHTTDPELSSGVALTTLASGLSADFTRFTQMNGKLFMANGIDVVKEWTGSGALANSTGMPTSGGAGPAWEIKHYENRLYLVPVNQRNTLYYSAIANPNDFTGGSGGGVIQFPEDGYSITNLEIGEGALLVSRGDAGLWTITFPSGSTTPFAQKSPAFRGAVGRGAATRFENVAMYLSSDALRVAGQLPNFPSGVRSEGVSENIQNTIDALPSSAANLAYAHYFRNKLYVSVPKLNSLYNDTIITLIGKGDKAVFSKYSGIYAAQMVDWNGYIYYTDSRSGQLWRINPALKSDDLSTPINFFLVTKHYNLNGLGRSYKNFLYVRGRADPATSMTLSWSNDFSQYDKSLTWLTASTQSEGEPTPEFGDLNLYFGGPLAVFGGTSLLSSDLLFFQKRIGLSGQPSFYTSFKFQVNTVNKKVEFISLGVAWKEGAENDYMDINSD